MKTVGLIRLGLTKYVSGLLIQQELAKKLINSELNNLSGVLVILEHFPVYTVGIRTKGYTADDEKKLKSVGADFVKTNRGGLITFHGPGQLVAYPILNLKHFTPKVRWYVSSLENCVIETCSMYGIETSISADTGVWTKDKKICALGIHVSRYITSHGLALNCNTDLTWFDHIVPCGIQGKGVTSLSKELNEEITVTNVVPHFLESFSHIFDCDIMTDLKTSSFETPNLKCLPQG